MSFFFTLALPLPIQIQVHSVTCLLFKLCLCVGHHQCLEAGAGLCLHSTGVIHGKAQEAGTSGLVGSEGLLQPHYPWPPGKKGRLMS
jgi:hypothetical protein